MSATEYLFEFRPMACPKLLAAYERMVANDFDAFLTRKVRDWRTNVEEILRDVEATRRGN